MQLGRGVGVGYLMELFAASAPRGVLETALAGQLLVAIAGRLCG